MIFNDRRNRKPTRISSFSSPVLGLMRDQGITGGILYPDAGPIMNQDQFTGVPADSPGVSAAVPIAGAGAGGGAMVGQ